MVPPELLLPELEPLPVDPDPLLELALLELALPELLPEVVEPLLNPVVLPIAGQPWATVHRPALQMALVQKRSQTALSKLLFGGQQPRS